MTAGHAQKHSHKAKPQSLQARPWQPPSGLFHATGFTVKAEAPKPQGDAINEPSPLRDKGLALLATGAHWKQVSQELGVAGSTVRSWQSRQRREKAQASQAAIQGATKALDAAGGKKKTSAGSTLPEESALLARKRKRWLAIIDAAAQGTTYRGKPVTLAQRDAASKALQATKPAASQRGTEGAGDGAGTYGAMLDEELIERSIVTACAIWGIARVKARLEELESQGQADPGGRHYPMPPLLGGEAG